LLKLKKLNLTILRQQTLQKYHSDDLCNFCAMHEAQNADNARTFIIRFDDKRREFYATNDFSIVRK